MILTKKIAIVHEFFHKFGGAERTLLEILKCLKDYELEIFFLNSDSKQVAKKLANYKVQQSWVGKFKFLNKFNKLFAFFYPKIIESFDLRDFDAVICSSNSFAHGVIAKTEAPVICYYHSPCRYIWDWKNEYKTENKLFGLKGLLADCIFHRQRIWDFVAAQRPDVMIANSQNVKKRIQKYYKRSAQVLYPPVEIRNFDKRSLQWENREDFYLIASTLTPYKKIDVAVKAFNKLGLKLIVAGDGPSGEYLKSISRSNIEFLGFVSDERLTELMQLARGFVFAGEEDFGIAPVEAMGHGCPIIAYDRGGLLETVIASQTGVFFDGSVDDLIQKLEWYHQNFQKFEPKDCHVRALEFENKKFAEKFEDIINKYV